MLPLQHTGQFELGEQLIAQLPELDDDEDELLEEDDDELSGHSNLLQLQGKPVQL